MAGIVHGGGLTAAIAQYGGAREDWLDLSTGINPNMAELPAIPAHVWNRLPDAGLVEAAKVAARDWYLDGVGGVEPPSVLPDISPSRGESDSREPLARTSTQRESWGERSQPVSPLEGEMSGRTEGGIQHSVAGGAQRRTATPDALPLAVPGTQSLIQILPGFAPDDRPVAVLSPTYGEYAHCFEQSGLEVDLIQSLRELRADHGMLVVVNPNNPDGRTFSREELLDLHARMQAQQGHLHVDEAFGDARPELSLAGDAPVLPGLTVSRSFGKFFGMAGIRLGFVFAQPETLDIVEAELGPWAVSGPALHIAIEMMRGDRSAILNRILERKTALDGVLRDAGLTVAGGTELFALVAHQNATRLFEHLARAHILVRKFDYAPDWLRIGLAPDEQGDRRLAGVLASFNS